MQTKQTTQARLAAAALEYAAAGVRVFPVRPGGKTPQIKGWQKHATTDQLQIARWWREYPAANIGIACGVESDLWVLDIDVNDKCGDESLYDLIETHGELPETRHAITGSGGSHYWFRWPQGANVRNVQELLPGVDVRGEGGFVVAPPSVHENGRAYCWEISAPDHSSAAPQWLVAMVDKRRRRDADPVDREPTFTADTTPEGRAKLEAECLSFGARTSKRNHWLNLAAFHIGRWVGGGEISKGDAVAALWDAAKKQQARGWGDDDAQIKSTIRCSLESGIAQPFKVQPRLVLRGDNNAEVVDRCLDFMADHAGDLYYRNGELVAVDDSPNGPQIVAIKKGRLRHRLGQIVQWYRLKPDGDGGTLQAPCNVPQDITTILHELQHYPQLRYLEGIATLPAINGAGCVSTEPGYDEQRRLLYRPNLPQLQLLPAPFESDARQAWQVLLELVIDFPFAGELDRATAVAGIMTAVLRHSMQTAPLFLFSGNTPGSGKSLLAKLCMTIASGSGSQPTATNASDEELSKQVTGLILSGAQFLLLDNIGQGSKLGGQTLDALITSERWSRRLLGGNQVFSAPNKLALFATGNNVQLGGDMMRRIICCYLDPRVERPDQRKGFRNPDLLSHALKQRAQLVRAVYTIAAAYLQRNRPQPLPVLGTFYNWQTLVREPVCWLSGHDIADTQQRLAESGDEKLIAWRLFLESWRALYVASGQTCADVARLIESPTNEHGFAMLEAIERLTERPTARSLGYLFRQFEGRVVAGYALRKAGRGRRGTEWVVKQVLPCDDA